MSDINVLAELERIGWKFEFAGDDEVKVVCPFHDDTSPSCHINISKRVYKCQTAGCDAQGDFISFLAGALRSDRSTVLADLGSRYALDNTKVIETSVVERYHDAIWNSKHFLEQLHKRGVTDELIRKYRIGEFRGRITIPITNAGGMFVNIRRYLPGAPGADKMRNMRGRGQMRLWPLEQLDYEIIVICAGELKAIVAAHQLNRHHIGAITCTGGEGNWEAKFSQLFKDKSVYVCYDIDDEGQKGAQVVLSQVYRFAQETFNVVLPLDKDEYPHGDVNDFCGPAINKRLLPVLEKSEAWHPQRYQKEEYEEPADVELNTATHADSAKRRIRVTAVASAAQEASYTIPKKVQTLCPKDITECSLCPVFAESEDAEFEIPEESEALLEMVASPKSTQREAIMHAIGVPHSCKVCRFNPTEFYNVEDVRLSPRLEISERSVERTMQPAICIGKQIELNETYRMVGRMYPHPKTQQSTLLISKYETTQDALSSYKPDDLDSLKVFQPEEWTAASVHAKLHEIYEDFETNVTRIFQRRELHLAVDLAYHSPLLLPFDGKVIKGWTEVLIVGDSSQGKSDTAIGLKNHYGLGEKVECKNATVAGLLGGLQSMGNRWFVTWGVIPTHDQRLVILEELKGTDPEVIAKLTDMRSSGIAEIPKIEKRRTRARTRLLAVSNPRSDRPLLSYNFGVEAIKELIGALEDIRRFDFCLLVSQQDIDGAKLNELRRNRPVVSHRYTSDLCRALILWAWTRKDTEVKFEDAATSLILDAAVELSNEFTEQIPIIDKGSTRYKIARLAAALATRTFSNDGDSLVVRECHVQVVVDVIRKVYNSSVFGYKAYSEALRVKNELIDEAVLKKQIQQVPFVKDFIEQLLHTNYIELVDIQDWCGWERREAQVLLSLLVRKHALRRERRAYRKTPPFIEMLKEMLDSDLPNRPDFIEEEEEF